LSGQESGVSDVKDRVSLIPRFYTAFLHWQSVSQSVKLVLLHPQDLLLTGFLSYCGCQLLNSAV